MAILNNKFTNILRTILQGRIISALILRLIQVQLSTAGKNSG